jgi:TetR/AcrR family transcriptional regulator, transcriptional repressor for nem operon
MSESLPTYELVCQTPRVAAKRLPSARSAPSRQASKDATRDALLAAGISLFAEQGLDGPSLDSICERAGKTRGAFYVHFTDRDDFLVAAMDRVGTLFLDAVIAPGTGHDDLAVTIDRFVTAAEAGAYPLMAHGGVRPHQLLDACARSPQIRGRYVGLVKDTLARLARLVDSGQRQRTLRRDVLPAETAAVLLAAVIGAQTMLELGVPIDLRRAASMLLAVLSPSGNTPPTLPTGARWTSEPTGARWTSDPGHPPRHDGRPRSLAPASATTPGRLRSAPGRPPSRPLALVAIAHGRPASPPLGSPLPAGPGAPAMPSAPLAGSATVGAGVVGSTRPAARRSWNFP